MLSLAKSGHMRPLAISMTSIDLLGADKWRRLAPAAIIHFIVRFVMQFIKQGVQGLAPLAVVIFTAGENRWFVISLVGIAVATILIVGAFLSYMKFRFRLSGDTFLIQQGVLKRKRLTLSYDRIQNVAFKQPIYFRPFNLVVLGIESAGSSSEEVSLGGIPRALAEEIRTSVFEKKQSRPRTSKANEPHSEDKANTEAVEASEDIIRQPISELVRYGLSNSQIWVFAGITAGALGQIDWDDIAFLAGIRDGIEQLAGQGQLMGTLIAIAGIITAITLLLSVSVIGAIITYYNYHLTKSDGRFHRTRGLFERHETSVPEVKIQSLVIRQSWPARLLNRFHLQLRQVGFSGGGRGQAANGGNNKLLVPSITDAFAAEFARRIYPNFSWSLANLKEINRAFTLKTILWIMMPIAAIPAISMSLTINPVFLIIFAVPILLAPGVMLRRARYGYATDGLHGVIRSGFIGYKLTLFPFYKVQTVQLWQSPGQRRKGLATLTIKLAGTSLDIPYMALADAEYWRDTILYQIESSKESWM